MLYAHASPSDDYLEGKFLNFYGALGLSPKATAEEIKRAYRKLSMENHPDRVGSAGKDDHAGGAAHFSNAKPFKFEQFTDSQKSRQGAPETTQRHPQPQPEPQSQSQPQSISHQPQMSAEEIAGRMAAASDRPLAERERLIQELRPHVEALPADQRAQLGTMIRARILARKAYSPARSCSTFFESI